ncbi:MAG: TolC family protein [Nitrospirae bacterium]|nr:TolC family protein [Nitrospirota bacterium]
MRFLSVIIILSAVLLSSANAAEMFSLRGCIETALKNQPAIRAARESVNAGQGRVTQARSPYLPQVSASTGYSENHSLGGAFGDSTAKSYTTTLSVNQVLYDFGRSGNTLDAARSGARSTELDEQRVIQESILNVKQAYFALLQAKKLVIVSQKTREQAESHLRQAEAFFRAGSRPKFDVTRAEVEVNSAQLGLINAMNSVRIRTLTLYNAMGIDPAGDLDIEDILSVPVTIPTFEQALEDAVKNRPEMLKNEADREAAKARVKREQSNYFPTLSANGAYNWANGTQEMGPFKGDIQNSWNAGVLLTIPLFEGGITSGKVSEARANLRVLEAQGYLMRQSIVIELNQANADIESASARIAVMELSKKKARENLELAQGRYEAGVGPYIEVTDAQVASVNAETDHVQALYDYQLAAARFFKAMGRIE